MKLKKRDFSRAENYFELTEYFGKVLNIYCFWLFFLLHYQNHYFTSNTCLCCFFLCNSQKDEDAAGIKDITDKVEGIVQAADLTRCHCSNQRANQSGYHSESHPDSVSAAGHQAWVLLCYLYKYTKGRIVPRAKLFWSCFIWCLRFPNTYFCFHEPRCLLHYNYSCIDAVLCVTI